MGKGWQHIKGILQGQVIVSVQASEGEPLNRPDIIEAMALSVLSGGAVALRMANTEKDDPIGYFKKRHADIPVIGLTKPVYIPKDSEKHVYITPGIEDIDNLLKAQSDIIAMDATLRDRPSGVTLQEMVNYCRNKAPDLPIMADIATVTEGLNAESVGFDLISTTLSGYTEETKPFATDGPDFDLLQALVKHTELPVVLEGRIWNPEEVKRAFDLGAFAVVIGSAITRPHHITRRFCQSVKSA